MQFRYSDKRLKRIFEEKAQALKVHYAKVLDGKTMRYIQTGANDKSMFVFVHGAPGSCKDFMKYLQDSTLQSMAALYAVDRMGYGYSHFGEAETSIVNQARAIADVVKREKGGRKVILIGHSYGGPVVARVAMDFPELVDGVVLLAAAIHPEHEKMFWFNKPMNFVLLSWMLPRSLRVANKEKIQHAAELQKMYPNWGNLQQAIALIHGREDPIVPVENSLEIEPLLKGASTVHAVYPSQMNHFLIWEEYEFIHERLLRLAKSLESTY